MLANAIEKVVVGLKAAKAPHAEQNKRLDALEEWRLEVDRKLNRDNDRFSEINDRFSELIESNNVTQRSIVALLDNALSGNNIKQMEDAKKEVLNHLTNKRG